MADTAIRGYFVWHDLMTPNAAGAHEFYGKTLGWKKSPWDKDPSYVMFTANSGPVGGSMEDRTQTPHWLTYIGTPDVDATVATAVGLGAQVLSPPDGLPNGGRYAALADPQGAVFGVYASNDPPERDGDGDTQPGEFSWHELATSVAPGVAFAFYKALFGWDEHGQFDMGPMGKYLTFGRGGKELGGMFDKGAAGKPGHAYWLGYVSVTDLEGTIERAKAARGSVVTPPMDVPGGDRIAQLVDPHGAFFALHVSATAAKQAAASKPTPQKRPAKKAAANKKPAARKTAKKKSKAKPPRRKAAKKTKPKAKARKKR
jgi:hypothetical protein